MKKHLNKITTNLAAIMLLTQIGFAKESVLKVHRETLKVVSGCKTPTAKMDLDINNIRMRLWTGGDQWTDPYGHTPEYEIPKGSGKHSIYAGALWMGGVDDQGNLKLAAQTYRQTSGDFFSGTMDSKNNNITEPRCNYYDRLWKVSRQDVLNFIGDPANPKPNMANATSDIKDWPGNGNILFNEDLFLAPFYDANSDLTYNPKDGDYPYYYFESSYPGNVCNDYLFGDQSVWWVMNDVGNVHTLTQAQPIGLEIQAQAFAFETDDEINNMTFYKYKIINRSSNNLNQTYFSVWVDPDLGYATDDYVGCDVKLGLGFVYNGDDNDDGISGYGASPPALGVDFFQGPLADLNDGIDNDKDGTIDEPGEQIIMSKFLYYNNNNNGINGEPSSPNEYYNYMRGIWLDGSALTCDGKAGTDPNFPQTDYMFPGSSNTFNTGCGTNWTEATAGNTPEDRRFLQSAGPFTLLAGAVNYISTGVVWAQSSSGSAQASVDAIKIADSKAQSLFDNCFSIVDGPSAPDVTVRELNNELIVSIENYANKKVEFYSEKDPIIPSFIYFNNQTISFTDEQRTYNFQGYQLFQLRDESVTLADLADIDKARLVAQCDIKDSIAMIVNYKWNDNSKFWDAQIKVQGENKGLKHAFDITKDAFAQGADRLINYKTYYYTLVSYAHNEYYPFFGGLGYPENPTQNKSYLRGRLNVKVYAAVPHNPINENFGTALNSQFAQGIAVQRIEGQGNGNHALDMSEASVTEALTAPDYRSYFPIYIGGHAPITVAVYDPMKLRTNDFETKLTGITDNDGWSMTSSRSNEVIKNEYPIGIQNEQMIVEDGISANIKNSYALLDSVNNDGFIEATLESEGVNNWLTFVKDNDNTVIENWIRSAGKDSLKHLPFTKILDGTVAPFIFVRGSSDSYAPFSNIPAYTVDSQALASVDIVFTSDKSKWTRCPVLEIQGTITQTVPNGIKKMDLRGGASVDKNGVANFGAVDNNDFATGMSWFPGYAINIETGERLNMAFGENSAVNHDMIFNPSDVMYDANKKAILGGFHYVYVFNHVADGPANMPRYDEGKFIHQKLSALNTDMKKQLYRECIWVTLPLLKKGGVLNSCDVKMRLRVAKPFAHYDTRKEIFEGTILKTGTTYTVKVSQITYNNNIYQPGDTFTSTQNISFSGSGSVVAGSFLNSAMPMYRFNTNPLQAVTNNDEASKSALDIIKVVPNPYYAYSAYEKNQLDNVIKITNVPSRCTISIYTINGTLIRKYKRDVQPDNSKAGLVEENNMNTSVNWDLKNSKAIPVASGMYIIHVDVPGIGVRTLHAMVIMRQVDVDTF